MTYGDFNDLIKRTAADKVFRDKAFAIAKDLKYDGYQKGLASMVYKFFDKKAAGSGIKSKQQNEQLAEELHKAIIRKFKKAKVYLAFKDNILCADLADMQLIINLIKDLDFYYVLLRKPKRKPNKIWVDKGSEFYNRSMKSWLQDNDIVMYSTHNERKSIVAENFKEQNLQIHDLNIKKCVY